MTTTADRGASGRLATAVVLPVAGLAAALVVLAAMGWRLQVVESGSMTPGFPVGALLVVEPVDPSAVRVGMPIVFEDARRGQVTHRVVSVIDGPEGLAFETRGDANESADPTPVPAGAVLGKVRWSVPGLGAATRWLGGHAIALLLVGVPAALLVLTETTAWRRRRRTDSAPFPASTTEVTSWT